ncbi:hypothetical protein AMAG_04290 [Allomyces macrogynus ATCC 38327]|uniref:Uncharacterized protein n=1 Tax=Allomyces macrogynus (strain ATCC 38327) TaxID=578462 RepID=A0A0L0S8I7_ALLM3|nr:hypothetical protein AMAG_04290 [Allomyces macrogynus ATCC 38327]|eukprot:KNE58736.1 hypothetical protein AMAG_04290 [Allomyces macrogynus ATCC 38327]
MLSAAATRAITASARRLTGATCRLAVAGSRTAIFPVTCSFGPATAAPAVRILARNGARPASTAWLPARTPDAATTARVESSTRIDQRTFATATPTTATTTKPKKETRVDFEQLIKRLNDHVDEEILILVQEANEESAVGHIDLTIEVSCGEFLRILDASSDYYDAAANPPRFYIARVEDDDPTSTTPPIRVRLFDEMDGSPVVARLRNLPPSRPNVIKRVPDLKDPKPWVGEQWHAADPVFNRPEVAATALGETANKNAASLPEGDEAAVQAAKETGHGLEQPAPSATQSS